ncbi:MAG: Arsenate reductase [Owenweeksia sp. TMED14]|nr:MAG: Arsenate reductase [Owenweeksia sp. TMED14]|tara:strand:- start:1822 stop:2169 length:348 start_codon:yes stop_codon:yes gene_type:complete
MKAIIYHNSRCAKSREALSYLQNTKYELQIIDYFNSPLSFAQLDNLIQLLDISPDDLIRKNENEWKLNFSKSELNDEELIYSMIEFPKLMQRPIVVIGNKGVVARPVSLIEGLLE